MSVSGAFPAAGRSGALHAALTRSESGEASSSLLLALEQLSDVAVRVASTVDLRETLEAVAHGVVESLGFKAAVLNLVVGDVVRVEVVAGPQAVKDTLQGASEPLRTWHALLERSTALGGLRFVDGRNGDDLQGLLAWVPDIEVSDDPDGWHPEDALFALLTAADGDLIGVLSVDMPVDGQRPGPARVELLERFGVLASLAIDRARMHQQALDAAELFQRMFDDAPLGMALLGLDGRVEQANATYAAMVQRPAGTVTGSFCWDLVHAVDRDAVKAAVTLLADGALPVVAGDVRDLSGQRWGRATASRIAGPHGPRLLVQMLDITDQTLATAALRSQARTDALTGLPNRAALSRHLDSLLRRDRRRRAGDVAVVFCDLDLFKLVNDTHGHASGDDLLVHVADVLRAQMRDRDLAARFGGDEFVVVVDGCDGPEGALAVAERIRAAISQPLTISGVDMHPSVSLGIALAAQGTTADGLLADAALYRAKETGRGRSVLFTADLHDHASARLRLRDDLRHAVVGQQLRLRYQPLVDLQTGQRVGYQAVLRWQHPRRGLLLPAAFLVELMEGDQAAAATDWTLDTALADANAWTADVHRPGPIVAVNLHAGQLLRPDLPAVTTSALARHRLDPERLLIEVSDDRIEPGSVQFATLQRLREAGVNVALTSFGTGHVGLHALRDTPADVIKLDSAFTNTSGEDPAARLIIEALVALCRKLGRTILAEGTETPNGLQAKPDAVWLEQDRHPTSPEITQP